MKDTTDMRRIPYGMVNFKDIREENCYFVDKTSFIRKIEASDKFFFFIRPRKFGKSLLISMLQHYYDVSERNHFQQLFGGLFIGSHPTPERNTYLVLKLNFSLIHAGLSNYQEALDQHCSNRFEAFCTKYADLLPSDILQRLALRRGAIAQLDFLIQECTQRNLRIYLFIDEYDHFTNDILSTHENLSTYLREMHGEGYLRSFFNTIKDSTDSALKRCFITGVSPVTLDDLTSGFNIACNHTADEQFNAMVGFTEDEVRLMLQEYAQRTEFHHTTDELIALIKPWYDNYCFAEGCFGKETMYNSCMVLYFLKNYIDRQGRCPSEMIDNNIRTDYNKLRMLIRRDRQFADNASVIQRIVEEGAIFSELQTHFPAEQLTQPANFVSLLYFFGMLTYGGTYRGQTRLIIPNQVVREQIYGYLIQAYHEADLTQDEAQRTQLDNRLAYDGALHPYFDYIAGCLHRYSSQRDKQKGEPFVHGFCLAMIGQNKFYRVVSEADTQEGYVDLFLRPELERWPDIEHSYIVELKHVKMREGRNMVEVRRKEALLQAQRYAASPAVQEAIGHTRLHKVIVVFYGMEMAVCEEV